MVSQSQHVNLSDYRKIENIWAQAIKQGKEVAVNVEVRYDKNGLRPTEFIVEYKLMEMLLFRIFLIRLEDIMEKIFEDYFSELQADMVSIC